jgi:hypothetical protein
MSDRTSQARQMVHAGQLCFQVVKHEVPVYRFHEFTIDLPLEARVKSSRFRRPRGIPLTDFGLRLYGIIQSLPKVSFSVDDDNRSRAYISVQDWSRSLGVPGLESLTRGLPAEVCYYIQAVCLEFGVKP